ncbi:MAG: hypothetical protein ABIH23_02735 [bacterium]
MHRIKFLLAVSACSSAVVLLIGIVYAGSLTPSASPAATSYTLSNIYTRLTTNATATEAAHNFSPSGVPAASLYTLTQIYDAIPTITANTVKLETSYLGVDGTLTPDGGTASAASVFTGATANLTSDWTLDIGTLTGACATSVFDGTGNKIPNATDGSGDGTNRWCMTDTGDAVETDILDSKIAWVDGSAVTGTMATRTISNSSTTVSAGYYAATTLDAVDADLIAGNVLTGVTLFGLTGTGETNDYPGTGWTPNGSGDGSTPLNEANCAAASGWYWFEDANGDGDTTDSEDGVCIQGTHQAAAGSWNGDDSSEERDNTYIADYTCSGNFPDGTIATYSGTGAGVADTTWNAGDCALCQADCYDGKKDLPDQGGYTRPMEDSAGHNGPITPEVLKNWKGTRLPTSNDFFGFCGYKDGYIAGDNYSTSCSSDTTYGTSGGMAGRTDECLDLSNTGAWEWLSGQHYYAAARVAGAFACSYFYGNPVNTDYRFRAVFRP